MRRMRCVPQRDGTRRRASDGVFVRDYWALFVALGWVEFNWCPDLVCRWNVVVQGNF